MRGKLDESMPIEAAAVLESAGWQCDTVYGEALGGAEDAQVGAVCRSEGRVLFTIDLDFADIRAYPPGEYEGIVVLRPVEPSRESILRLLARAMPVLSIGWVAHRLWILEPVGFAALTRKFDVRKEAVA
jgi:predicted nuclease of predicted toxin-antitoxin system